MVEKNKVISFPGRKPIPKSVRFAVFKRDAFTCQYCGAKAPDVLLQIDHIKPVADGGENDPVNLVTSCTNCNSGKGAEALDENSIIEKQRRQLDELNERRNQLEMMLQWREGLRDLESDSVEIIQAEFLRHASWKANETGIRDIRAWLKKYGLPEILDAVSKSFTQYLKTDSNGAITNESWNRAFYMVPRLVEVERRGGMPPDKLRMFYIRGILRKRLNYVDESYIMSLLKVAYDRGVDLDSVQQIAKTIPSWTRFRASLEEFIKQHPEDGDA